MYNLTSSNLRNFQVKVSGLPVRPSTGGCTQVPILVHGGVNATSRKQKASSLRKFTKCFRIYVYKLGFDAIEFILHQGID